MNFLITVKPSDGELVTKREHLLLARYEPGELGPVRMPGARKGQPNIPGYFWMSKLRRLVWYESRLEMVVLKQLDFDPLLVDVLPQPFVLHFQDEDGHARHVPDYLAWYRGGKRRVLNVKPRKYVDAPRNRRAFDACSQMCREINWDYSTQTEPNRIYLANLNWLAGYRRRPPKFADYATKIIERVGERTTIGDAIRDVGLEAIVRPVLFHLLWTQQLAIDMNVLLENDTILAMPS